MRLASLVFSAIFFPLLVASAACAYMGWAYMAQPIDMSASYKPDLGD